jgi:hypothetical protein
VHLSVSKDATHYQKRLFPVVHARLARPACLRKRTARVQRSVKRIYIYTIKGMPFFLSFFLVVSRTRSPGDDYLSTVFAITSHSFSPQLLLTSLTWPTYNPFPRSSAGIQHNTLVLPALDVLQRLVKVLFASLHRRRLLLVAGKVGMDQLYETVKVLRRNLSTR